MSQIIVPSKRIWTRQPQRTQPLVRAIAEINPIGANFAVDASLQGKPFAKTSQYEPAIRVQQGAKWYFHGETNVYTAYYAEFEAFTLSGEYTVVLEIFGNLYTKHVFLTKGVGGVGGIAIATDTSYSGDGSGTLSMQVIHYGVASYSLPVSSFRPKQAPCTIVITGKANDVAKCWINGVFIGSVAVGNLNADTTSPVRIGRPSGNDDRYFYGGISLGFVASKRVSDGLAQSISSNPWQIFARRDRRTIIDFGASGTTAVYADSALTYYVRAMLSSDSGVQYAIRNAIYQDDEVGYYLRASVAQNNEVGYILRSAIAQNSEVGYVLRSAIAKDDAEAYKIRGLVQSSDAETYSIRGLVQTSDSESYKIRGQVQADASASYDIQSSTSVASSNAVNYSVRGAVAASAALIYSVRGSVQKDTASAYSVRSAVSRDVAASYTVSASVSSVYADSTASYSVDGVVPSGPSAESIAAAVLAALQATPIPVNNTLINGAPVIGDGSEANPWRGVGV